MRLRGLLTVAVMQAAVVQAQDVETEAELKKFQGTWVLVSGEVDGEKTREDQIARSEMAWTGNEVVLIAADQSGGPIRARIRRISPGKSPKEMEWVRLTSPNVGKAVVAIYELSGDSKLTVCFDPTGKAPPKVFGTKKGSGQVLHVWKRVKTNAESTRR